MRVNLLRERFAAGETVVNAWLSSDSRYAAECLSYAGYDCVTVDLQHGMFGMDGAIGLLQAIAAGPAIPMARCTVNTAAEIGKLLDAGAYGVICPSIDDGDACAAFVAACRYPPVGRRSFGPSRGLLYGGPDYLSAADATIMTWAMVESSAALENLDDIAATDGLDGIYVGPNDLALSLGEKPGGQFSPAVKSALKRVAEVAHEHARSVGAFCAGSAQALELLDYGYDMVTPGNDISLLRDAASSRLMTIRERADRPHTTPGTESPAGSGY